MPRTALVMLVGAMTCAMVGCTEEPDQEPDPPVEEVPDPPPAVDFGLVTGEHALTEAALEAIALAPDWLQPDMRVNLVALDDDLQDALAELMLEATEPRWLDELAFCLAHVSPTHLQRDDFYPELLVDNIVTMFDIDELLDYAEIIDVGDPEDGGDYYSTIRYAVAEDEVVSTLDMDRYYYYWYVVHPVLEDEAPTYVDPDSGDPADPPTGRFWRDYLYFEADEGYLPLADYVEGYDVLWERKLGWYEDKTTDNGALGGMIEWVQDAATWGSEDERPIQPVRIYAVHLGRCGEHQDLTSAAGRIAMIPMRNVSSWGNDHVWNEFWEGEWIQTEPQSASIGKYGNYYNKGVAEDNDCDGEVDEETWAWAPDADDDGDGYTTADGDCRDHDNTIYPGAAETADAEDNDCNGIADDGADVADADGDGVTIAEGDCDDWNDTVAPGNTEDTTDGLDNDCDGIADLGLDDSDADEDGYSIAMGDCDDTEDSTHPGAVDIANGRDDDCNTLADDGADVADRDGDGVTIADGDCDDSQSRTYPGAPEVEEYRALAISANRGDGLVTTVSENYGPEFDLQVAVTDANGDPVDGATILIAGERLDSSDIWAATWGITDASGLLDMTLGGNYLGGDKKFYGRADSAIGSSPTSENMVTTIVSSPVSYEQVQWDVQVDGELPRVEADFIDHEDSSDLAVRFDWQIAGFNGGANYATGVVSREPADPAVKVFVIDADNLALYEDGESFEAIHATDSVESEGTFEFELADTSTTWHLLAVPVNLSGSADVQVTTTVSNLEEAYASEVVSVPVVAGDHVAVSVAFDG